MKCFHLSNKIQTDVEPISVSPFFKYPCIYNMEKKVQTKKLISQENLSTKRFLLRVHEEKDIEIDM